MRMEKICASDAEATFGCAVTILLNPMDPCWSATGSLADAGMLRSFCTPEGRLPLMQHPTAVVDAAACEADCPGALALLGEFQYVQMDQDFRFNRRFNRNRRLSGHGEDARETHAMMDVLCPSASLEIAECFFNESTCELADGRDRPAVMDNCNAPMAVTLNMALTVADPAAFVANEASQGAVEQGIADAAGNSVSADDVDAVLSVGRRLAADLRNSRRLQGTVNVEATILAGAPGDVAALETTMGSITANSLTTSINAALTDASVDVTVTASEPVVAAAAAPSAAAPAPPPGSSGSGSGPDDDSAFKATMVPSLLVALFAQFCAL